MRPLAFLLGGALLALAIPHPAPTVAADPLREAAQPRPEVLRWQQRRSETGAVPSGAVWAAIEEQRARLATTPLANGPSNWTQLGPGNIGGRIRSIVIHPTTPATMWVGSVGGGVWKTTNGGAAWTMLPDLPGVIAVACMAMSPSDPNTIYAGTGEECFFNNVEGSSNSAVMQGAGIFKTTDGGNSWTRLPSTASAAWNAVSRIAIDPNNAAIMLASTISGIWRSTDAGATWSQRTTIKALDVKIDPNDSSRAVAGRGDGVAQYSIDGGVTWNAAPAFAGANRIETAYAKSAPGTVYAAVSASDQIKVWRSTDGGQTYSLQTTSGSIGTYSRYNSTLWVDPTNANTLVVGGVYVYRSVNAGVAFTSISGSVHPDIHAFVPHPGYDGATNKQLFCGNDGGIHRTTDILATSVAWTALNNGLAITQFYGCCVNPTSGVVLAGAQDNGTVRYTTTGGLNGWTSPGGGDGSYCAADQTDPNYFYMQSQFLAISRSSNAGASGGSGIKGAINDPTCNFIAYILLDPNDQNRLYACGARLWRASNAKTGAPPTWVVAKPALTCLTSAPIDPDRAHFTDNPPCNIATVAVAPGNSNIVWVGHNNGHVYFTTNALAATPTWTKVDDNSPALPDRWVSRIVIDPTDANRVTVSFMGFTSNNVWRTTNSGTTWAPLSGSGAGALPSVPVSCIVQHRVIRARFYAATDLGLYYTEDDGASWAPAVGGPSIVSIDELVWKNERTLVLATHGRSVWTCDVDPGSVTPVGTGCGSAATPSLGCSVPAIGKNQTYTLANANPSSPVTLLVSAGPASPTTYGPCVLQPALAGMVTFAIGTSNGTGGLTSVIPIPSNPALVGAVITVQEFIVASGGPMLGVGELTNGLQMTFGF